MRIVCAWCQKIIRDDENAKPDDPVSHGICVTCKRIVDKEFEELKKANKERELRDDNKKRDKGKD